MPNIVYRTLSSLLLLGLLSLPASGAARDVDFEFTEEQSKTAMDIIDKLAPLSQSGV